MNIASMVQAAFERGYTVRKFPGGERYMFHRWPASKIKGARPLSHLVAENVTRSNALFAKLARKI